MLLTPTYHVFEMYKVHQGARLLENELVCNAYAKGGTKLAALNVSASKKDGVISVSICNLDPTAPAELECRLDGMQAQKASGRVLTAEAMNAHNTFDKPNAIQPTELKGIEIKDGLVRATLPAKSVAILIIQ